MHVTTCPWCSGWGVLRCTFSRRRFLEPHWGCRPSIIMSVRIQQKHCELLLSAAGIESSYDLELRAAVLKVPPPPPLLYTPSEPGITIMQCMLAQFRHCLLFAFARERERERELLQSAHISLWEHSSHNRLIGRGVPDVSFVSPWCSISLFGLLRGEAPRSPYERPGVEPRASVGLTLHAVSVVALQRSKGKWRVRESAHKTVASSPRSAG